jgi:4-azaleucine resistance transporter AzlC
MDRSVRPVVSAAVSDRSRPVERRGWAAIAPVVAAVTVFGVSYGVLARAAGLAAWEAVLMSATVFAGSSQFAVVSVLGSGGSAVTAVVSAGLLNARYVATGISVARVLPGGRIRRFLLAQLVVDESYALGVGAGEPGRPDASTLVRAGGALWLGWVLGSLVGVVVGPVVGEPTTLGLDAAFPALFVALLWPMLDDRPAVRAALAGLAVGAVLLPFTSPGIALAGAAAAGLALPRRPVHAEGDADADGDAD